MNHNFPDLVQPATVNVTAPFLLRLGKDRAVNVHAIKAYESGGVPPLILTLALDGGEWSASYPQLPYLQRRRLPSRIHGIGCWVGPKLVWMLWTREKTLDPVRN
jgi:hypothetical protein